MKRDKSKWTQWNVYLYLVWCVDKICADHFDNIINLILIFFRIKFYASDFHYSCATHETVTGQERERETGGNMILGKWPLESSERTATKWMRRTCASAELLSSSMMMTLYCREYYARLVENFNFIDFKSIDKYVWISDARRVECYMNIYQTNLWSDRVHRVFIHRLLY